MPGVQHDEGQLALIAHAERDPRHVVCLARAGTGKTTTLRAALPRMRPGLKRVLAFNRDIADEWRRWKEKHNRIDLEVATFHALAIKTVSAWVGKHVEVDRMRGRNIARRVALGWQKQERAAGRNPGDFQRGEYVLLGDEVWSEMPWNLHKFVELLKNVHPTDLAQVERLAKAHGYANKVVPASVWARLGARCLRISRETFSDKLDFADAMYLPRWFGWRPAPVRDVLVDELQDMNTAQLWLARASLDPTDGRLVAIGDDRQAIYHWRGADPEGVQTTIKELNACIVRMSVTYRCARRVVEHVRSAVEGLEDFTARPDAPEGTVQARTMTDLIGPFGANLGDFVLSRSNAPLIVLAAHWLRRHVPLVVSGKDIGVSLLSLVERADCRSNRELFNWLVDYLVAEESRLDGDVETLRDITDRVHALQALVAETQDPEDLCNTLRQMYRLPPPKRARKWGASGAGVSAADMTELPDIEAENVLTLSTIHRAKGRERKRVWLLVWTCHDRGKTDEGDNCYYVGATRAMDALYLVQEPGRADRAAGITRDHTGGLLISPEAGQLDVPDFSDSGLVAATKQPARRRQRPKR